MAIDKSQRYLSEFLKVGRTGKIYYVFGAPKDLEGPYDSVKDATAVHKNIIDNYKDYEVVDRKIRRKE